MANLTVWEFATPDGAPRAATTLRGLEERGLINVHDAAVVTWPSDRKRPRTTQMQDLTARGALSGSFWGLLMGLLFFAPVIGLAIGAISGGISGSMKDVGIDDDFIASVRAKVTPGTSALFVLSSGAVLDEVTAAFEGTSPELISTNLSPDEEAKLREVFDDD